jgi:thiamine-monophosphate kinase
MTTLRQLGEFGLIRQIQRQLRSRHIGDDCAVLPDGLLITCDPVIENIHYLPHTPPRQIGHKAMARNLSDIAAMAGQPTYAVVSLALRPTTTARWVHELYAGMTHIAGQFGCRIVGGDTAHVRHEQTITITLLGQAKRPILRTGAKPGHLIYVTGKLGGSFQSGKHLTFTPKIRQAQWLAKHCRPSAMLDISDGLANDLQRLAEASQVGLEIESHKIPKIGTLHAALTDGEDFELLFTIPAKLAAKLPRTYRPIGQVVRTPGIRLDGQPLHLHGYDHFQKRR